MYGKYGITPINAMTINVYDIDNVLVHSFPSQIAAANWLGVSNVTVSRHIKSGKIWNKQYVFQNLLNIYLFIPLLSVLGG